MRNMTNMTNAPLTENPCPRPLFYLSKMRMILGAGMGTKSIPGPAIPSLHPYSICTRHLEKAVGLGSSQIDKPCFTSKQSKVHCSVHIEPLEITSDTRATLVHVLMQNKTLFKNLNKIK